MMSDRPGTLDAVTSGNRRLSHTGSTPIDSAFRSSKPVRRAILGGRVRFPSASATCGNVPLAGANACSLGSLGDPIDSGLTAECQRMDPNTSAMASAACCAPSFQSSV
jgi:hypothetical protein